MIINYNFLEDLATVQVGEEVYRVRYLMLYDNREKIRVEFSKIYTKYGGKFTGINLFNVGVYKKEKFESDGSVFIVEKGDTIVKGCKSCVLYIPKTMAALQLINRTTDIETYSLFSCTSYMFDKKVR